MKWRKISRRIRESGENLLYRGYDWYEKVVEVYNWTFHRAKMEKQARMDVALLCREVKHLGERSFGQPRKVNGESK